MHGIRARPYKSAYVTAKHALEGLSKVIALEDGSHGVTSNCVSPGYVRTQLVERQVADRVMLVESAIKRLVVPEEVADLVLWFAGDTAGMVTGTSHLMDGGWSAR